MADLHDYHFRQRVTELELDEGFEFLEQADRDLCLDWDFSGVAQGMTIQEQGIPNLTVDVSEGVAYSKAGERIGIDPTPTLDLSVDENAISTEPGTPGNSLVISIFVEFARVLTDPRIDGNAATVFFNRFESFNFVIRKGPEAASPGVGAEEAFINANGSPLDPNLILIGDVLRANGQTALTNSDIFLTRRENTFKLTAGALDLDAGTAKQAVQAMLQELSDHINDVAGAHDADAVAFDNTGVPAAWSAVGAATQVQAALDGVIDDLGQTTSVSGAELVGFEAGQSTWALGTNLVSTDAQAAIDEIVDSLGATTGTPGTALIGFDGFNGTVLNEPASRFSIVLNSILSEIDDIRTPSDGARGASRVGFNPAGNLAATDVQAAIEELDSEKGGLGLTNTWSAVNIFQSNVSVEGAFELQNLNAGVAYDPDSPQFTGDFGRMRWFSENVLANAASGAQTLTTFYNDTFDVAADVFGAALYFVQGTLNQDGVNDSAGQLGMVTWRRDGVTSPDLDHNVISSFSTGGGIPMGGVTYSVDTFVLGMNTQIALRVTHNDCPSAQNVDYIGWVAFVFAGT